MHSTRRRSELRSFFVSFFDNNINIHFSPLILSVHNIYFKPVIVKKKISVKIVVTLGLINSKFVYQIILEYLI